MDALDKLKATKHAHELAIASARTSFAESLVPGGRMSVDKDKPDALRSVMAYYNSLILFHVGEITRLDLDITSAKQNPPRDPRDPPPLMNHRP